MFERYQLVLNSKQFEDIKRSFTQGRAAHAYIIEGPAGAGKRTLARLAAALVVCQEKRACLTCSSCRRALEGVHPDIHDYSSNKRISVKDMRALIEESALKPYEADYGVYIVENAHTATAEAQNCLLKTLEEPAGDSIFMLLALNAGQLLPTVRSRCRLVRMTGFSDKMIFNQLSQLYPGNEKCAQAASLAGGNIGRAVALMENGKLWDIASLADRLCAQADHLSAAQVSELLRGAKDKMDELLPLMEERLIRAGDVKSLARLGYVEDAARRLEANVNPALALDGLAYYFTKGETKWQR